MGIEPERIVNTMSADDLVAWTETHADRVSVASDDRHEDHAEGEEHDLGGVGDEGGAVAPPGPRGRPRRWRSRRRRGGRAGGRAASRARPGRKTWNVKSTLGANQRPASRAELLADRAGHRVAHHDGAGDVERAVGARAAGGRAGTSSAASAGPSSNGSHGGRPMAGRHSITCSQNGNGSPSNSKSTPSGSGSRKPRSPSGPAHVGHHELGELEAAPRRAEGGDGGEPGLGARVAHGGGELRHRAAAPQHAARRPPPGRPAPRPANIAVRVRSVCSGWPSTRSMARTAMAATTPPCGAMASCHGVARSSS